MIKRRIAIKIPAGLEARPIALFVQIASQYESRIYVLQENKKVNAKSIMGMMNLELVEGKTIEVEVDGKDEENAIEEIEQYLTTPSSVLK